MISHNKTHAPRPRPARRLAASAGPGAGGSSSRGSRPQYQDTTRIMKSRQNATELVLREGARKKAMLFIRESEIKYLLNEMSGDPAAQGITDAKNIMKKWWSGKILDPRETGILRRGLDRTRAAILHNKIKVQHG